MTRTNTQPTFSLSVSFRAVAILVTILVSSWIGFSVAHYYQTKRQIRDLFAQEAREMATALALGERAMAKITNRLEEEQAERLLAIGFWLRDLEKNNELTLDDLKKIEETTNIFNAVIFDSEGKREIGLRGGSPSWGGGPPWAGGARRGGGRGQFHSQSVEQFLQNGSEYEIEGIHRSGGFGGSRFSVMVRRIRGGAIMINISAQEQEELINQFGPRALLSDFAARPNIQYVLRKIDGEIEERFGQTGSETSENVFEVESLLPDSSGESLTVGFNNQPILANDRILFHRLVLSIAVIGFVGFLILLWSHLQRSYVRQSKVLQQLQSYQRTVLDTMEEAVIAWRESGAMTFWNRKAEKLYPELAGQPPDSLLPNSIVETHSLLRDNPNETIIDLEEAGRGKRRYRVEETMISEPFQTHVLFLTDITAVEEVTREHDRREHLEALANVASGVAHEVRNPLNTIDMSIQTICMEPSTLHPDDRETLQSLRTEIGRINAMVEHFLAYGRPQPPVFSEVDIGTIVQDVANFIEPTLNEKQLRLRVETSSLLNIKADAQQIKQALLNITLNAIEASSENQEIRLKTEERNGYVVCVCQDRGIGMSPEQIQTIFDPYITHKPGGTGLGMSIVKRILDSHHGTIEITSAPGEGTKIELLFPRAPIPEGEPPCRMPQS